MNKLFVAAQKIQRFFQRKRWRYCIIGGVAVLRWGESRATRDVDISLLTGFGNEERFIDQLLAHFPGRFEEARQFALESRVLLCQAPNGAPMDISLAAFPFEERIIARASRFTYAPRVNILTCSAEDLVVLKAFADRDQDWVDIDGILIRQRKQLDWNLIIRELKDVSRLKEDADLVSKLRARRSQVERELRGDRKKKGSGS